MFSNETVKSRALAGEGRERWTRPAVFPPTPLCVECIQQVFEHKNGPMFILIKVYYNIIAVRISMLT